MLRQEKKVSRGLMHGGQCASCSLFSRCGMLRVAVQMLRDAGQCCAMLRSAVRCRAEPCDAVQCCAMPRGAVRCRAELCDAVQCCATLTRSCAKAAQRFGTRCEAVRCRVAVGATMCRCWKLALAAAAGAGWARARVLTVVVSGSKRLGRSAIAWGCRREWYCG
jgi:hypothetical protein